MTNTKQTGFTIVELLIVIVVIGILAAITIVAFNGIQDRARSATVQSDLISSAKQLEVQKTNSSTGTYPATLTAASLKASTGTTYSYSLTDTGYCLSATNGTIASFVLSFNPTPQNGTCAVADSLIGWWPFNGNASDMSGNGNDGVITGAVATTGAGGKSDTAYRFDGNDQVVCGTNSSLRPTAAVTISSWVYPTAYSNSIHGIVNYGGGGYWLYLSPVGLPTFYISSDSLNATTNALPLNQWSHIASTYTSGQRSMYVNGNLIATDTKTGTITNYSSEICRIGTVKNIADRFFIGSIDDVRIYNRALSGADITTLYGAGAS